jgi:hypothetical protein
MSQSHLIHLPKQHHYQKSDRYVMILCSLVVGTSPITHAQVATIQPGYRCV